MFNTRIIISALAAVVAQVPVTSMRSKSMQRLFMLSLSAVVMTYAANAAPDSPFLKGTYGFTITSACVYALGGFDANFQAIDGFYSQYSAGQGTRTFNGDGTGTLNEQLTMYIRLPPQLNIFEPFASSNSSSASFTYTVNEDDTFTLNFVPGTFKGTVLTPLSWQGRPSRSRISRHSQD